VRPHMSEGRPASVGTKRSMRRFERQHVVLFGLCEKKLLQVFKLVGIFGREVLRLAEVVFRVVELPFILAELRRGRGNVPGNAMPGHRGPAVMIDSAVAEHFKVLRAMPSGRFRIGKCITMLTPSIGFCLIPFTNWGCGSFPRSWA
jgi:hypothetical protein